MLLLTVEVVLTVMMLTKVLLMKLHRLCQPKEKRFGLYTEPKTIKI